MSDYVFATMELEGFVFSEEEKEHLRKLDTPEKIKKEIEKTKQRIEEKRKTNPELFLSPFCSAKTQS